jgi:predicted 3-demethylubiquinone-9 3-methyltransferase (glyoxalase superfamily)
VEQPITPFLWFDDNADEAVDFYISLFPDSRRVSSTERGPDVPGGEEGTTLVVDFELGGAPFMALNGGPEHPFTPAISFVVSCADQEEVDFYWERLLEGGGTPVACGWLTDRFGVSWQVVPKRLSELMADPDPERARRVTQAMLKMVKLEVAELEAAAG